MPKIYTTEDLLRYIYKETSSAENRLILAELQSNQELAEELENLQIIISQLNEADLNPHPTSVNLIMEYAHKLHEPAH